MKIDHTAILMLMKMVKRYGAKRVSKEMLKLLEEIERRTGRNLDFEKREFNTIIWEI